MLRFTLGRIWTQSDANWLVEELRGWLLNHFASEDVAFGEFLRGKEGRDA